MNIKKTSATNYLEAIGDYADGLLRRYEDYPLVQKLVKTLIAEQRERVTLLLCWNDPYKTPDHAIIYTVFSSQEIEALARSFFELFIEKEAASDMMGPPSDSIEVDIQEIRNGELKRKINRMNGTLKSIDTESQSLVYQFRRSVQHSKNRQTFPKTMAVLREIRKVLRLKNWEK